MFLSWHWLFHDFSRWLPLPSPRLVMSFIGPFFGGHPPSPSRSWSAPSSSSGHSTSRAIWFSKTGTREYVMAVQLARRKQRLIDWLVVSFDRCLDWLDCLIDLIFVLADFVGFFFDYIVHSLFHVANKRFPFLSSPEIMEGCQGPVWEQANRGRLRRGIGAVQWTTPVCGTVLWIICIYRFLFLLGLLWKIPDPVVLIECRNRISLFDKDEPWVARVE